MNEVQKAAEPRERSSSAEASRDRVLIANKALLLTSLLGHDRLMAKRDGRKSDGVGGGDCR